MSFASGLLAGTRIVSIEQYISGPYCTSILSDAGAEVIKVERPDGGDPRRGYAPRLGDEDDFISGGFASYNRGKKSVTLDLRSDEGIEGLRALLREADVFVANLRPGAISRLGLDISTLREEFPRLVVCEITGFGVSGGPYGEWPAFDSVIQAMSGLSSLIGSEAEAPPGLAPMSTMDLLTGIWAALGVVTGLASRAISGEGCHVDTSMYDVGAALLERPLTLHEFTGEIPTRGIDRFSPVGMFKAADGGWVSIVIPTDEMWRRCCTAIERADLICDPELASVEDRAAKMKTHVIPALEDWAQSQRLDRNQAVAQLRAAGQPAGPVQTVNDVRSCPQLEHRRFFTPLQDRRTRETENGALLLARTPLIFNGKPAEPGPVPELGQHNEELLGH